MRDPIHTVVGRYKGKIKVWDVVNEAIANLFRVFLKHEEYVKVVTLWGVNDAVSWRAESRPLLIDGNDQPKPAFDAQPSSQ